MSVASQVCIAIGYFLLNFVLWLWNENNTLTKNCSRWAWTYHATNTREDGSRAKDLKITRPSTYWCFDVLDARHMVQCAGGKGLLLGARVSTLIFWLFAMLWQAAAGPDLANDYSPPGKWITWFTNWTFVGFGLQAVLAILVSLQDFLPFPAIMHCSSTTDRMDMNWLERFFLIAYVTISPASICLTIFYWAVVYDPEQKILADNPFRHGVNLFFLFMDLFLSRIPVVTYHFQCVINYGTVYVIFMWLYNAGTGIWRYTALNVHLRTAPIFYIVLPILLLIGFLIMYAGAALRERFWTGSCQGCAGCCTDCACYCCSSTLREQQNTMVERVKEVELGNVTPSKHNEDELPPSKHDMKR